MGLSRYLRLLTTRLAAGFSPPVLKPKDAYALWADSYPPEAHNPFMKLEEQAMLELMPDLKDKVVLDLACGSGRYLAYALARGASVVFGLDFSPAMLIRAGGISTRLVQGDMISPPLASGTMDVILCGLAIGHVRELDPVLREMSRLLRPGGFVLYSDPHPFGKIAGWKRNFHDSHGREHLVEHHFHMFADHHAALRSAGLSIEAVREPLIEGEHEWAGCPAVLVICARRN